MELLHFKKSGDCTKHFECCETKVVFHDSISCNKLTSPKSQIMEEVFMNIK